MIKILQIDGGDIRGVIPATVCAEIEKRVNKPCHEYFDLITGSSTGAILGATLAAGIPAIDTLEDYKGDGLKNFVARPMWNPMNWLKPKFNREKFIKLFLDRFGDMTLKDLKTKFMATSFGLCAKRTHFIKSWEQSDQDRKVVDVISWSGLSAAYYFGKINVPQYEWTAFYPDMSSVTLMGESFQDGGQGMNNCTLGYILTEILANNWDEDEVYILSLGTGDSQIPLDYESASKMGFIDELTKYPSEARNEAMPNFVFATSYISKRRQSIVFNRLNTILTKEQDKFANVDHMKDFIRMGERLATRIPDWVFKK